MAADDSPDGSVAVPLADERLADEPGGGTGAVPRVVVQCYALQTGPRYGTVVQRAQVVVRQQEVGKCDGVSERRRQVGETVMAQVEQREAGGEAT